VCFMARVLACRARPNQPTRPSSFLGRGQWTIRVAFSAPASRGSLPQEFVQDHDTDPDREAQEVDPGHLQYPVAAEVVFPGGKPGEQDRKGDWHSERAE